MPSSAYHLLPGAFAGDTAPFALHPKDRERAETYRTAAIGAGLAWTDIEVDIREYLASRSMRPERIEKEVARARGFFKA